MGRREAIDQKQLYNKLVGKFIDEQSKLQSRQETLQQKMIVKKEITARNRVIKGRAQTQMRQRVKLEDLQSK